MDKFEIQKLRDLPIEGVAERLGLQVSRHKCLCPFHADNHPSLSFKVSKNTFRCFVCGASGGPIDLVMKYQNLSFKEACRWLADEHNIILEWQPQKVTSNLSPLTSYFFLHKYWLRCLSWRLSALWMSFCTMPRLMPCGIPSAKRP